MRSFKIVAGGGTIPTAYSASNVQSRVLFNIRNGKELVVKNKSGGRIAFCLQGGDTAPASNEKDVYLDDGDNFTLRGKLPQNSALYIRSDTGSAITISADGYVSGFVKEWE